MFRSNLTRNGKFQKKQEKFKKIKRIPLWLHFKPKHVEKGRERRKTKIIVPFQTNSKKIQKIVKYYYGFISSRNKGGNAEKGIK